MDLNFDKLELFIEQRMNELHVPGLGIGIVKGSETIYSRGFGHADIESKIPVSPETVFRFASISKTFTAIGIMQLVEQGKLSLDDNINNYLSKGKIYSKKKNAPTITIKHLLTHTSGIGEILKKSDLFRIPHFANQKLDKLASFESLFEREIKLRVEPEKKWAYANFAYDLLGFIVQTLSDKEFSRYMIENILNPLEMNNSDFKWTERVKPNQAKGYKYKKGGFIEFGTEFYVHMPAGSLYASMNDMIKYMKCLLNGGTLNGKQIIKKENLEMMMTPHFRMDDHLPAIGYCFMIYDVDKYKIVNHGGSINGYLAELYLIPEENLGIIIAINQNSILNPIAIRIAHDTLHKILEIEPVDEQMRSVSPGFYEGLKKFKGRYGPTKGVLTNTRHYMSGGEIKIYNKSGELYFKTMWGGKKKGVRMCPADPKDSLYYKIIEKLNYDNIDPYEAVIFKEDSNGKIISLLKGYREYFKKSWYKSFKFKLYSRTVFIILGIIISILALLVLF